MDEYRKAVVKYNGIKEKLESKRQEILNSGKTQDWINKEIAAVNDQARKELLEWQNNVKQVAEDYSVAGQEIFQDARRKPAGKTLDPATLDFHRGLAKDAFIGRTPDEILQAFDRVVGELREDELGAKWVYENTAKSLVSEPSYEMALEEAFSKHRTQWEVACHKELARREVFRDHDSTIRGLAQMDIEAIQAGEKPVYNDLGSLHDELMNNL